MHASKMVEKWAQQLQKSTLYSGVTVASYQHWLYWPYYSCFTRVFLHPNHWWLLQQVCARLCNGNKACFWCCRHPFQHGTCTCTCTSRQLSFAEAVVSVKVNQREGIFPAIRNWPEITHGSCSASSRLCELLWSRWLTDFTTGISQRTSSCEYSRGPALL